ncbi:hypothetical protein GOBAR_AA16122 [Gossypium barbadense]|uniref:Disease resistance protein RGA3 n=1 Tax=Gossypium barbadense TaxID=3634 RepID=A0A2P5XMH2_GOSBA|nr:hypothetical protein GOBAR_AA16122 [Gossypium barbadense]
MAEAIAFDIATELITKLSSRALSQVGLWWNLKHDIDDLTRTVRTIKAVLLDAEEKSVTDNLIKVWLEELKDVLYDADDLLDDFSAESLRKDLMGGNKLTKEVRLFFSSSNQFAYGLRMGGQIKAIKARLTLIGSEANNFGFLVRDRPIETSFMTKKRPQTHSFVPKDKIIGRDDDKASLLKLMLEFESEENVYIIPIVGFGGLGKTALAQFVYNDKMVHDHFELKMWVCVSDVFDVKIIVENIIKSATNRAPDQNLEIDQLQRQLRDIIDGKKYLLDLDDIWNEEREEWISLKELLVGGVKGSRIIVTTRSSRVAKITSKCQPYVLKGLSDDDAWCLFKEIAFEQRYADSTNSAFVEIGRQILERCGGVPLVIRTIASTLFYKETEKEWRSFKNNELVRISQNEGFIKQLNPSQSPEEIGFGYFKNLVDRSFFQEVLRRFHPLFTSETFEILPESICKIQNLLVLKLDGCWKLQELLKKIEKLVNLTHLACRDCFGLTHMPRGIGKLTSLETLSEFVVDKDGSHGGADLSELRLLNNLRGQLQIRNLGFYMDDNSPKGSQGEAQSFFPSLKLLRLWDCPNMRSCWRTKKSIDDDSNEDDTTVMGTATTVFPCLSSLEIENCPLTSMPLYPSLDGELELKNTNSRPLKQTIKMNITSRTPSSSTSSLPLSKLKSFIVNSIEGLDTHTLDECLQHLTGLKTLEIRDCKEVDLEGMQWERLKNLSGLRIDNIPKLVSLPIGLRHLVQLKTLGIRNCSALRSPFPVFQHLTFLEYFSISNCKELELSAAGIQIFQDHTSLRFLGLENIPKCWHLPEWLQHLTNLQELYLIDLPNLTSLPDEMRCLTNLQILEIGRIPELEERCRKDIGADWHKIAHIPIIQLYQKNKSGILNLQVRGVMPFFIQVGYC